MSSPCANEEPKVGCVPSPSAARLTFDRVRLQVDVTFWMEMRRRKLSEWRLTEPIVPVAGMPTSVVVLQQEGEESALPSPPSDNTVVFSRESFQRVTAEASPVPDAKQQQVPHRPRFVRAPIPGKLHNHNALASLRDMDADAELFISLRENLLAPLLLRHNPATGNSPASQSTEELEEAEAAAWRTAPFLFFAMHAFVDAKNYVFHHREAFPAMSLRTPVNAHKCVGDDAVSAAVAKAIRQHCAERVDQYGVGALHSPFICQLSAPAASGESLHIAGFAEFSPTRYARMVSESEHGGRILLCYQDAPRELSGGDGEVASWGVRNFLTCLRLALPTITHFTLFPVHPAGSVDNGPTGTALWCECAPVEESSVVLGDLSAEGGQCPSWLKLAGWCRSGVRAADISSQLSTSSLAEEGSRLNLELMKWRQLPSLELGGLTSCRALLLGTGTLGCNVARNLLMWGVRHLTLVDRGGVRYSNLARQSLFSVEDAATNREKTVAAAAALRAIIPTASVEPVTMTIHMPGHRTDADRSQETIAEIERLDELVQSHDVVFLLTDSREARWLPTLLTAAHDKPVINVALGFDSYVVMRHGAAGSGVRCYFCSDVSAPADSISDRALDQQCTVTRPGVSSIASALAVELLASMYQVQPPLCRMPPLDQDSPSPNTESVPDPTVVEHCRLGVVPQQIRGSVFTHTTTMLCGERNPSCTACASPLIEAYRRDGCAFLLRCVNDPVLIEEVCGLQAVRETWGAAPEDGEGWSVDSSGDETE